MTEEQIENEMTRYFKLGIISGIEQSSNKVFSLSIEAFKRDDDKMAKDIKEISKILLEISLERQIEHDKEYPKND